jgi:hypothetical protein
MFESFAPFATEKVMPGFKRQDLLEVSSGRHVGRKRLLRCLSLHLTVRNHQFPRKSTSVHRISDSFNLNWDLRPPENHLRFIAKIIHGHKVCTTKSRSKARETTGRSGTPTTGKRANPCPKTPFAIQRGGHCRMAACAGADF